MRRTEYPRPNFKREKWKCLNGVWKFYYGNKKTEIEVPFVCQSQLSGIGERITEDFVVYENEFTVPKEWKGEEIRINFGAVDYRCCVYINNQCVGTHIGGQTPFSFQITRYLNWNRETIRVEVEDPLTDETIPRGKQFWEDTSKFIWYTPSTGIWQSVWLEPLSKTHFEWIYFTPDIDEGTVKIEYKLSEASKLPCRVHVKISLEQNEVFHGNMLCDERQNSLTVDVFQNKALNGAFHFVGKYWSPENPILYDVVMKADDGDTGNAADEVASYFGMRKIHIENGKIYLNNQPYYQKLLLDQGYWKESLITAPTDADYKNDIQKAKAMGFNGCRKHEKVEDPRFLYWADKLGFLVWEAMASFWVYTPQAAETFMKEWMEVINRDYNHPSIIVWGMLNESWGTPQIYDNSQQQDFSKSLYYMVKSIDSTRLVISNDGWEMTVGDICAIHSYKHGEKEDKRQHEVFAQSLKSLKTLANIVDKNLFAKGSEYKNQPVVLTECGGISLKEKAADSQEEQNWGYTTIKKEEFIEEYDRLTAVIFDSEILSGFCYTQFTDVEQETNGLLTDTHEYKFKPEEIKRINDQKK